MLKSILHNPRKGVSDFLHVLSKKISFEKDRLNEKQLAEAQQIQAKAKALQRDKKKSAQEISKELTDLELRASSLFPAHASDSMKEWVEVFLVAAVIAISFKTFFLQPFKIPTNSMYPTLYGVVPTPLADDELPARLPVRIWNAAIHGKSHHRLVAKNSGTILSVEQGKWLGIPFMDATRILIDDKTYTVRTSYGHFISGTHGQVRPGVTVKKGDVLANFTTETGDHLFVNKMSYHFRKPHQGEVFVFTTNGIWGIESRNRRDGIHSGQFYIKRCTGVPGVELQIKEPKLFSNGELLDDRPIYEKIYSRTNGYGGYTYGQNFLTGPNSVLPLKEDQYWAMGDNSANSLDSRSWGTVPRTNLVGTGLVVYWPFTKRWGLIK